MNQKDSPGQCIMANRSSAYSDEQFTDNYPAGMENHYWIVARNRILKRYIQKFFTQSDIILDVGCGTGVVVDYLVKQGIICYGVELGTPLLNYESKKHIHTGVTVRELPDDIRNSITSVLLLDVLEHLENPYELLNEIRMSLPNVSKGIITVPARNELWSNYDEHFGHHLRYSKKQLCKLIETAGGRIAENRYFFHILYLPMLLVGILRLKRKTTNLSPTKSRFHRFIASLFTLEEKFLSGKVIGTSLLACFTWKERTY